ncbi:hypothetical protein HW542_14465 [Asaia spathodeae]|uniref:Imm33-like domain-containing protein n=1 Tax=Asaia spathodeae TaxID=657016 RepID=A0ABX2P9G6_9PROT
MEIVQKKICERYGSEFFPPSDYDKVGISQNVKNGTRPLNGMRINPEHNTSGWYIWGGEILSKDPDFFLPLHYSHVGAWENLLVPYLGLAPGWRFLITETYEDVWFDGDNLLR